MSQNQSNNYKIILHIASTPPQTNSSIDFELKIKLFKKGEHHLISQKCTMSAGPNPKLVFTEKRYINTQTHQLQNHYGWTQFAFNSVF